MTELIGLAASIVSMCDLPARRASKAVRFPEADMERATSPRGARSKLATSDSTASGLGF